MAYLNLHLETYDEKLKRINRKKRDRRLAAARKKGRHTAEQWTAIKEEVGHRCVKCGTTKSPLAKDHIIPIYQGGSDGVDNIQPLCYRCNSSKFTENFNWLEYRRVNGWGVNVLD